MKKHRASNENKRLLLSPGQPNPLWAYPPYSSSKSSKSATTAWRSAVATVSEVTLAVTRDSNKHLIDQWVEQLIRIELGTALDSQTPLKISLPMDVICVIHDAMQRRAGEGQYRAGRRPRRPHTLNHRPGTLALA
jgi:hypothetical protein